VSDLSHQLSEPIVVGADPSPRRGTGEAQLTHLTQMENIFEIVEYMPREFLGGFELLVLLALIYLTSKVSSGRMCSVPCRLSFIQ
jgi:hypothetical protein